MNTLVYFYIWFLHGLSIVWLLYWLFIEKREIMWTSILLFLITFVLIVAIWLSRE